MDDKQKLKEKLLKKKLHLVEVPEEIKKKENIKHALANAFMEDENIRKASQERSVEYLKSLDEQDTRVPEWQWNLLYFALGILFVMTIENVVLNTTLIDWLFPYIN